MKIVIIISLLLISWTPLYADWQATLEAQFDIVETFDNLPNWHGVEAYSPAGDTDWNIDPNDFPDQSGGSGRINYYSNWASSPATQDWIKSHDATKVWRGSGKSASIDIDNVNGPSRLGFFIGDLNAQNFENTGYMDMYLFFMAKIPKNYLPTSCPDGGCTGHGTGVYEDGQPLAWTFVKFFCANMGCDNTGKCSDTGYPGINYSNYQAYPHFYPHDGKYEMVVQNHSALMTPNGSLAHAYSYTYQQNSLNTSILADEWVAIEIRLHNVLINDDTDFETHIDMWIYDQNGTSTQVINNHIWANVLGVNQPPEPWNNIFFGGNNSNNFVFGPTMDSTWYLDDVIVDGSRIGPTYFTLLGEGTPDPDTTPPTCTGCTGVGVTFN